MKAVTKKDIIKGLKRLGLEAGDSVMVHSSLSSFGRVAGGADSVIDALLETVGGQGTVIVPTFGCDSDVFDADKCETGLGIIPRTMWKRKQAVRSRHPLASVAAIGAKAKWLVENHEKARIAHGKNTPYTRLTEIGGKILLLGADQDRSTSLHTVEELAKLAYLRPDRGKYIDADGKVRAGMWRYFPGPHRDFIGLQAWMESSGLVSKTLIGSCVAQLMPFETLMAELSQRLKAEPYLFISRNPNLPGGIWQRADILRAEFKKEAFTLAADSQYAGRFMEEIVDNLKRFGIDNVVLSYVNNVAWNKIDSKKRKWYLQGLRLAGINVAAIKVPALTVSEVIELLKESKSKTLIVPSTSSTDGISKVTKIGFKVCVENLGITGSEAKRLMERLSKGKGDVALAFNPLGFVQVGQTPFAQSYTRSGVKRYIELLYINDGLATGRRTALEEGLTEIKEIISILRCRSFAGLFVLQGTDSDGFSETAKKFISMLKELGSVPKGN